jgi:hypothetical protein
LGLGCASFSWIKLSRAGRDWIRPSVLGSGMGKTPQSAYTDQHFIAGGWITD